MSYIVKSSLGIEPTILPWNEVEKEKLIREKNKYLKKENKVIIEKQSVIPEEESKKLKSEDIIELEADEIVLDDKSFKRTRRQVKDNV